MERVHADGECFPLQHYTHLMRLTFINTTEKNKPVFTLTYTL